MTLRIRFRDGEHAGKSYKFPDEIEEIVIGRDPRRCQVVMPADLTVVGREHVALRRSLGRYRLVLNGDNPVYVDGKPGMNDMELPPVAELQLGTGGPVLVAQTLHSETLLKTQFSAERPRDAAQLIQQTAEQTRSNRRAMALVAVVVLALGGVGAWAVLGAHRKVSSVEEEQARVKGLLDEEVRGLKAMASEHSNATRDLQQRIKTMDQALGTLQPDLAGLKEAVAGIGPRMAGLETRIEELTPRIEKALAEASPSVYLVCLRGATGAEQAAGTAWVIGDGVLGTAGHVAELLSETETGGALEGATLFVRSMGASPKDHAVKRAVVHPGYFMFTDLWQEYQPTELAITGQQLNPLSGTAACDVGLLYVDGAEDLAAPLTLADDDELHHLAAGQVVGFVGYPSEGMVAGGVNVARPTPITQIAHIAGVTNYFLAQADPDASQLIQHSLPATGGASGSPIFDAEGHVVAVLNAGNVGIGGTGERMPSAVLVNFAQRADLLRELLSGSVDERQTVRTEQWREGISTFSSLRAAAEKGARDFLKKYVADLESAESLKGTEVNDWSGALASDTRWNEELGGDVIEYRLPGKGAHVFFAFATMGNDIDLAVLHETDDTRVYGEDTASDWFPIVRVTSDGVARVRLLVRGGPFTEYRLVALHFQPR